MEIIKKLENKTIRTNMGISAKDFKPQRSIAYFDNQEVKNRIIRFQKKRDLGKVVFVPNWRAREAQWSPFLDSLTKQFSVDYFESREKSGTKFVSERIDLGVSKIGEDLANYLNQLDEPYHLVGASIGTSSIIKIWDQLIHKPLSLTFICPILQLRLPVYFRLFQFIPNGAIPFIVPGVNFLLKHSKQMKGVARALRPYFQKKEVQELSLIRNSAGALLKTKMKLSEVEKIDRPTMVLFAEEDRIHLKRDANLISSALPDAFTAGFENFRALHKQASGRVVGEWIKANTDMVQKIGFHLTEGNQLPEN